MSIKRRNLKIRWALLIVAIASTALVTVSSCARIFQQKVSFEDDIRPIFKNKCMSCHGGVRQQGGLSLLFEEDMRKELKSGKFAVVPGKPHKSEIYNRIIDSNPERLMPPESGALSESEVDKIYRWIDQGAEWEEHWAYKILPTEIEAPVSNSEWVRNDIDNLVLDVLKEKNISPSEEANPRILIRRLYLDLIGLPPSLEIVEQFAQDPSEEAYEGIIDDLLQSKHFGERWGSFWLDLARYADSQGFQKDHIRKTMWMYRDWVIEAFNRDMPIDSFTMYQLAGDLMQEDYDQALLATAFHRNTMTNDEGGTDDEEYRIRAVMDRMNTTMEIWQGSTFACVQCHSHPYDPIRHEEFYAFKGFFNNTADRDLTSDEPKVAILSSAQKRKKKELESFISSTKFDTLNTEEQERLEAYLENIKPLPVPVLKELPEDESRENPYFVRGNWTMQTNNIPVAVPASYDKSEISEVKTRLDLAEWLMDEKNPLTGRVMANRIWEQIFGQGLVKTSEDFGIQGELPANPALLDYLAINFSTTNEWRLKPFLKNIVLSSTYRQSSNVTPEQLEDDPSNKYLGRGPRFRLNAEQIRDQALSVSDLLNPDAYGPSVMPYQPDGVWNVIRHVAGWKTSENGNNHRRGIYTFYRRVSPYPTMLLFDAPSREFCVSRRIRTNTPLQALVTLNDPVFVEAIMNITKQAYIKEAGTSADQIKWIYKKATCSELSNEKLEVLENHYLESLTFYQENEDDLMALLTDTEIKDAEFAALHTVSSTIMNLDEFLMKK